MVLSHLRWMSKWSLVPFGVRLSLAAQQGVGSLSDRHQGRSPGCVLREQSVLTEYPHNSTDIDLDDLRVVLGVCVHVCNNNPNQIQMDIK